MENLHLSNIVPAVRLSSYLHRVHLRELGKTAFAKVGVSAILAYKAGGSPFYNGEIPIAGPLMIKC